MELKEKVKSAPTEPGCYLFKDSSGKVIYVGKAKNIRSRVRQYFLKSNQQEEKGLILAKLMRDVEFIVTPTERDALIREYRLIKQYKPWFNTQYKADRMNTYYLSLNQDGVYPSFEIVNAKEMGGQSYLADFTSESRAREALRLLNRVFKIPVCNKKFEVTDGQPCLHYRLGQCLGPCGGKVEKADYEKVLAEITGFFRGKQEKIFRRLQKQLTEQAAALEFEKASETKQMIDDLKRMGWRFGHTLLIPEKRDLVLFFRAYREEDFSLFFIRNRQVIGRCDFEQALKEIETRVFLEKQLSLESQESSVEYQIAELQNICADKLAILLPRKWDVDAACRLIADKYNISYKRGM